MKRTQKILIAELLTAIVVCALAVILFETNTLEAGCWAENKQLEFVLLTVMELVVLCMIPLSLKLFKFQAVHKKLTENPARELLRWGTLRMMLLAAPLVMCTIFYYLFFMKPAFCYLAIILLLCIVFIVPTMNRCKAETSLN